VNDVEQSKVTTAHARQGTSNVVSFSLARREVNVPIRLCAKQISHFVDASTMAVRNVLIHEGFHPETANISSRRSLS